MLIVFGTSLPLLGGGGPENVLLVVQPEDPESLFVANYYRHIRNIPDENVVYIRSTSVYADFTDLHEPGILGSIINRGLMDHIDFIVVPSGSSYFQLAPGLVTDSCSPVTRFSATSPYTMMQISASVLDGDPVTRRNEYFSADGEAIAFDGNQGWLLGVPSESLSARRYFLGCMLGYSGVRGNTVPEIIEMIDRSVAVDATFPSGTFYFMKTTDPLRSPPRDVFFLETIADMIAIGASAVQILDVLPIGMHDCLGVMTGWASPEVEDGDFTMLPGSFGDHLTSFAATFATSAQTKMSEWIRKGCSGSWGNVEEPCNYPGKYPHPRMHYYYFQGLSLAEAVYRSIGFVPFQGLFIGDPLTRPFSHLPDVSVSGLPAGNASGMISFTPMATTSHPTAGIARFDLLIDGRLKDSVDAGQAFNLDTTLLDDGVHELRVVAYEDTPVASQGRWIGTLTVDNLGRSATVTPSPVVGDRSTVFTFDVASFGAPISEIRLMHHGRVIAATSFGTGSFMFLGDFFGGGVNRIKAVAEFADGSQAWSAPVDITVTAVPEDYPSAADPPEGVSIPVAYSHTIDLPTNEPIILHLAGSVLEPVDDSDTEYHILSQPSQAVVEGVISQSWVVYRPDELAEGEDSFTYRLESGPLLSNIATVTVRYGACLDPQILNHPESAIDCVGESVTFSVTADDSATTYQWFKDGEAIVGAVEEELIIPAISLADEGSYTVLVGNICGFVNSEEALLSVQTPPTIAGQPLSTTGMLGGSVGFLVTATGPGPITYAWYHDGEEIPGAASAILIVMGLTADDIGDYTVVVTNPCGSIESEPATLTIPGVGILGDSDGDGDVDLVDFGALQLCFGQPAGDGECAVFDFDGDRDIDLVDFAMFQLAFTGSM
jgi:hypothetical protein